MAQNRFRRFVYPLYKRLETKVHPLRYLFLEITQKCNLSCRHCGSDCGSRDVDGELSTDEWCALIQRLPSAFDRSQLMPVITGGEPFCHPELVRIARSLAQARLVWGLVTNGYSVPPGAFERLGRLGLRSITISLDGLEQSHNWLRGRPDSFSKAVECIGRAVNSKVPALDVVTCVNNRNKAELDSLYNLLSDLGVKRWRIFITFPRGRARNDPHLLLADGDAIQTLEWIATRRTRPGAVQVDFSCEAYLPSRLDRRVRDEPYFCRAGICIGSVLSDGSISACPNIPRSLTEGNVRIDDLGSIWETRFQRFRNRSWMKTGNCVTCGKWPACQGNSMHLWDDESNKTARCYYRLLENNPRV